MLNGINVSANTHIVVFNMKSDCNFRSMSLSINLLLYKTLIVRAWADDFIDSYR